MRTGSTIPRGGLLLSILCSIGLLACAGETDPTEPPDLHAPEARPQPLDGEADAPPPELPESLPEPDYVDVFVSGEGYNTYRIPSLIRTEAGTLLAFAEGRVGSHFDKSNNDIVLRRSLDGGESWEPMQVLHDHPEASLNDPTPVQIRTGPNAGRILLMYEQIPCRSVTLHDCEPIEGVERISYLMTSDDDGASWRAPPAGIHHEDGISLRAGPTVPPRGTADPPLGPPLEQVDVVPLVLAHLGLPGAYDLPGVVPDALLPTGAEGVAIPLPEPVESYQADAAERSSGGEIDDAIRDQLRSLGYVK